MKYSDQVGEQKDGHQRNQVGVRRERIDLARDLFGSQVQVFRLVLVQLEMGYVNIFLCLAIANSGKASKKF